uniref:uncharacterized protein LOC122582882 n=1 Tax=Erigeron canadensis TaxID=72917 RepID=UPI001CB8A729|nr:uncharacterized protein LOC122582882 [Erigeron canadensis]
MDKDMEDVDKRVQWLHSEQYSAAGDIFGEPQKTCRIGDRYQAQIPSLMTENERVQLIQITCGHAEQTDVRNHFGFGLPIPVSWVHNQHKNKEETMESGEGKSGILGSGTGIDLFPVPCSSGEESGSDIEHKSFLLGLYLFGKNLRLVNRFMGSKGISDVISYYYGKFYRSGEHQKWSMYLKKRGRKSMPGKNIFKGWRRQELLSRLLPRVTDECKTCLTEASSTFDEGVVSFEKYICTLRDAVGIHHLVEAVGIGIEKQDLAVKVKKRARSNKQVKTKKLHSDCASLETEELVNILKDRIGLSKSKLDELFWEAVWPRLLAKGWHSEQPRNYSLENTNHSLVFLAPGVVKFSRRSLAKGSHYFESFTEVLNKVALEPHLIGHEPDKDSSVEPPAEQGSDDEQHMIKFTIVDTSLVGPIKAKEITSPTLQPTNMQALSSVSGGTELDTIEVSQNEDVQHNRVKISGALSLQDCETSATEEDMTAHLEPVISKIGENKTESSTNVKPVRKLKLIFKTTAKPPDITTTKNDCTRVEDTTMQDPRPKKKHKSIGIDLNSPRVAPVSDFDYSLCSAKESVSPETSKQPELWNHGANGQRQSTRNRPLTTKALEALANGLLNPKKKRGLEDGTHRRVRPKTALVSSCGASYLENRVDRIS